MEYLLKASAVVAIFYICYKLFLQRETFFQSNRLFLVFGLIVAAIIPYAVIPIHITKVVPKLIGTTYFTSNKITPVAEQGLFMNFMEVLPYLYITGVIILSIKFLFQFSSLAKLVMQNKKLKKGLFYYVLIKQSVSPFSFFRWIVYNPIQFDDEELKQILTHERVHAYQLHSIDIILAQFASIIFWFNPLIWFYKKDLQQNLEFIADSVTEKNIECKKSYQHLLLKTSIPNYQLVLANNFYNSLIKKRIAMLHKNKSQKQNQWKLLFVIPLLALFLVSFNTKEIITYKETTNKVEITKPSLADDIEMIMITKNMSNDELKDISKKYGVKGIQLKFKGIKRNDAGEITSIAISAKTENSKANYNTNDDDGISPIKITIDAENNKISIGNSGNSVYASDNLTSSFVIKKGENKIHKSKKGHNVFVYSDSDHEHENEEEHEHETEVIEDDGKIMIKSGNTVFELKKDHNIKKNNAFVISAGKGETIDIIRADTLNADGKIFELKGNVVFKSKGNANSIFTTSGEGQELIELKGDENGDVVFIRKDKDGNIVKEHVKAKGNSFIFESEDGKVFKSKSTKKGSSNVWISNDDNEGKTITKIGKNGGTLFVTSNGNENPLIIIDGKEVKNKNLKEIDPDTVAYVNVLKGKSAEKKYGKKGKDGVIEITLKKKKD